MKGDEDLVIQSCIINLRGSFSILQAVKCLKGRQAFRAAAHLWNKSRRERMVAKNQHCIFWEHESCGLGSPLWVEAMEEGWRRGGGSGGRDDDDVNPSRMGTISYQRNKATTRTEGIDTVDTWTLLAAYSMPGLHVRQLLHCTSCQDIVQGESCGFACKILEMLWAAVAEHPET